ncbi:MULTISPECIES: hypothetical protein [unclassified Nocardioides]|uniref:hypothetical protein n=1 Tax=unclassified Nocardioides TaxID=2615069 RepID=UPI0005A118B4|nr:MULTISPECIES: hypothetical protein [unclassified Nocardioides]
MQLLTLAPDLLTFVVSLADEVPQDDDVKAGWLAFGIFIGLIVAVALLGSSLVKQLRKAQAAKAAGVYGPVDDDAPAETPADQQS